MPVASLDFISDVYNSLTIHGLASANQLPTSVLEVEQFWRRTAYDIGGLIYSLDDIEHGVLRGKSAVKCRENCVLLHLLIYVHMYRQQATPIS